MQAEQITQGHSHASAAVRALVVDDSRAQRRILALQLQRWGFAVTEAESGSQALALWDAAPFDVIISDWMMPGMSGVEFCHEMRKRQTEAYSYFILLTSKSETAEITRGLEAGADDFLTKPFNAEELRARLRAGERIVSMQRQVMQKNAQIRAALDKIQDLYDALDRDLQEARKLQLGLMQNRTQDYDQGQVNILMRPSGHVGGDLAGSFRINQGRIGVYSVDVSGHGVASAMMTARLAGLLSGGSPDQNIAIRKATMGQQFAWEPHAVAARLNRLMIEDVQAEQYFTLAYAEVDLTTGEVALVQAGHPHPVILRADGRIEVIGGGGLPIGLIPEAPYETVAAHLQPGDRLMLLSDGVTECPSPQGDELGQDGLVTILHRLGEMTSPQLIEALQWELVSHHGKAEFPDDVSALILDYYGPVPASANHDATKP
ncbi:MAG: SpoIIE family protein phosphatase [Rhodobacteraceae bacterium]|nr:SpoIIE family protein phosphatase [Paracoccaceae bacterium]